MISIVLATYNGESFLQEQLNSIVNQTRKPDEIIIIDDASTDRTVNIISKFHFPNIDIKFIQNKKNFGPAKSFAKGIQQTKGDLIFLCDQDDIWIKDKIENLAEMFEMNPDIKVLCTGYHLYDNNKSKLIKSCKDSKKLIQIPISKVIPGNVSPGCTMAFRSIYRDSTRLINENIFIHDWFLTIMGALDNGLYLYDKPLIYYRIHSKNTIGKNITYKTKYTKIKRIDSIEKHLKFYHELLKLQLPNRQDVTNKFKHHIDNMIQMNEVRIAYLKKDIKSSIYYKSLMEYRSFVSFKTIIGDLLYARKKN